MNNVKLVKGNKQYEFAIDQCKLIMGNDYISKFSFLQMLYQHAMNLTISEYEEERQEEIQMYVDESIVDRRKVRYFKIGDTFEFQEDFKLTTKSLLLQYSECLLNQSLHNETISTIRYLFQSLSDSLNIQAEMFHFRFHEIDAKQLSKLLNISIVQDELESNVMNLSYENYYTLQLAVLYAIEQEKVFQTEVYCIVKMDVLIPKIYHQLKKFKQIKFIVILNQHECKIDVKDIYYFSYGNILDFANENQIYDLFSYKLFRMEDIMNRIDQYFNDGSGTGNNIVDLIMK